MKIQIKHKPFGVTLLAMPDIAFLLLIFLIITVSTDEQGNIELPDFEFLQETEFPETMILTLSPLGEYTMEGQTFQQNELEGILSLIPSSTVIHLMADRACRYSDVDFILGELQKADLRDVVLIMNERNQDTND